MSYDIFHYFHIENNFTKEFIFRLPFIIISLINIILFYFISKKVFDNNNLLSLFATLLFISEIWFIYLAKYMRFYSITLFFILIILSTLLYYRNYK